MPTAAARRREVDGAVIPLLLRVRHSCTQDKQVACVLTGMSIPSGRSQLSSPGPSILRPPQQRRSWANSHAKGSGLA